LFTLFVDHGLRFLVFDIVDRNGIANCTIGPARGGFVPGDHPVQWQEPVIFDA
jgi:hypothetical protein